jgi:Tfp pilus assembly protein PilE
MKKFNQQGYNLVELAIAVLILGAMAAAVMTARSFMAKQTETTSEKTYATQKAIQMFEELKALVNGSEVQGVNVLDDYNDGSTYNKILTTDQSVTIATDPLSGNRAMGGGWKYWRQINVTHVAQDPFSRIVDVKVYGSSALNPTQPAQLLAEIGGMLRTLITQKAPTQVYDVYALSLYNVLGWFTTVPQMYDTFNGAVSTLQALNPGLEFRPHFITQMGFGRDPFYNPSINVAQDTTVAAALPWVYLYPGLTPQDSTGSGDQMFFDNNQLQQSGNIIQDGVIKDSTYGNTMCDMYCADMRYPDAVAWYAAVSQTAVNGGNSPPEKTLRMILEEMNSTNNYTNALMISMHGEVLPLPNMRNYSDAAKDPFNLPNVRVVAHPENIHYITGSNINLRVYAYVDGLENPSTIDTAGNFQNSSALAATISVYIPGATNMPSSDMTITAVDGGIFNGNVTVGYNTQVLAAGTASTSPAGMKWTSTTGNMGTTIFLINTPLRCPEITTLGGGVKFTGLPSANRLYNTEYIPCSVDTNTNYNTNLTTATDAIPKNTARWLIQLKNWTPAALPDGQYAIETRLGNQVTTGPPGIGTVYSGNALNEEPNLSRTFVWIGTASNATSVWNVTGVIPYGGSGVVPFTEQFQYNGDPRDCPYLDVKFGSANLPTPENDAGTNIPSDSYNWFFKGFNGSDGYSGFGKAQQGYGTIQDMRDAPRYYYTYRRGMMKNSVVYANMNGYSFWHASEGGEIGGTYNPYSNSLQFNKTPWDPGNLLANGGGAVSIDEIQTSNNWDGPVSFNGNSARVVVKYNAGSHSPTTNWYAKSWVGEMYPDDAFVTNGAAYGGGWVGMGNLPTGTTGFWRVPYDAVSLTTGTTNGFDNRGYQWGIGATGPSAFMLGSTGLSGAATAYGFMHTTGGSPQLADVQQLGLNIYPITNFPLDSPISCTRPWAYSGDLIGQSLLPAEWGDSFYKPLRTILTLPAIGGVNRIFYQSETGVGTTGGNQPGPVGGDSWRGLGAIQMSTVPSAGTTTAFCYYIPSGIAPQGNFDSRVLVQISVGAMLRTFLDGGILYASGVMGHIPQLPLFQIGSGNAANQFTNPSAVTLSWSSPVTGASLWLRWAGFNTGANFYTEEYPGYNTVPADSVTNSTYTEPVTVEYVPMYSPDGGNNFYYCNSFPATLATVGTYYTNLPAADYTTASSITWSTPASGSVSFPQGTYKTHVEAYRVGYPLHYSYHELDLNFTR